MAEGSSGMVRTLIAAISLMTLAIAFLVGMIVGRLLTPAATPPPAGEVDFARAPELTITLPQGAELLDIALAADRATLSIRQADGDPALYTAPLTGFDGAVRLVVAEEGPAAPTP